jgi:hypothetical protein
MSYLQIDPVLFPWAKIHGLHIYTTCRDDEIRSIDIVDDVGDSYSLGVGSLREDGTVAVWVSEQRVGGKAIVNRNIQSQRFTTTIAELRQTLELAYRQVESLISQRGHKRTPIL